MSSDTRNSDTRQFSPGQRWLSDTESELGLGSVVASDARTVQIAFPAAGETRIYARREAPLTRVAFVAGDRIRDRAGRDLAVVAVDTEGDVLVYRCRDARGATVRVPEAALDDHLRLNRPQEKLLAARIDGDTWFALRHETWRHAEAAARSPVLGLVGARAALIPHQLYIAATVAARYAPRVLLADEVGLGKTIEAGLIVHRLLLTGRASRVLIVVPEPLLHQWLVEMLRRFNLRFALFDQERLRNADGDNPFQEEQRVLCSLSLLTADPQAARGALDGEWDMLVVDEAHHLHWTEAAASPEYDLAEALARRTPAVLLLTATPEQLGRAGHFGRLRLLDPQRFHDYAAFLDEERRYAPVAELAGRLLAGAPPTADDRARLAALLGEDAEGPPALLIERLVDRHGTGRVLFRNTRAAIEGFPERRLIAHPLPLPEAYAELQADALARTTPEVPFGQGWTRVDPRVDWLAETLRALRPAKALVICAHASTVRALREALHERHGIHAAMFHEGMPIVERDRAAAYFADPEEGTQVLLCSEIGSEGRNFQFAHHLLLLDLPLEPDLLEQRIGRLDRIGQTETIRIHVPYLQGGPGEVLLRWYAEGLGAFTATCPAADAVHEALGDELLAALAEPARTDALVAAAAALSARLNAELEAGRDRLLELNAHRPEASAALVEAIERQDADPALRRYMERYWAAYGVEHEANPGASAVLQPGAHMRHEHFPQLPEDGATVTFDRGHGLAHEDREFLTWEHPMVRGAMELLTTGDLGSTAVVVVSDPRVTPGTFLLELIYVAECPAPAALGLGRFLPPTALRLLLDPGGRDLAAAIGDGSLRGECLSHNRKLAGAVIKSLAGRLRDLFARGEALAADGAASLQADAAAHMHAVLDEELHRLRALAEVNPGVRADELAFLGAQARRMAEHLAHARMRLDAARVIVGR